MKTSAPLERLRSKLVDDGLQAMLVSDIASVHWLTGFNGSFGFALVTGENAVFVTDSRYALQADEQVESMETIAFSTPKDSTSVLVEQIERLGVEKIGFESESVTFATHHKWAQKLPEVSWVGVEDIIGNLRLIKEPWEVERVRNACALTDACFAHACKAVQVGATELDVSLEIEFFIRRHGAEIAFPPIVVSGERSARPHGRASDKKLGVGDFVTMDFGAKVEDYCADLTRTVVVGEATDRHREVYGQVLKAETSCIAAMKPGMRAREVDGLARTILDEKGLAKYFGHGLGHGLGRLVHDAGRMNSSSETVLEPGQIWTVEPGAYIPGFGGVRIEDDVVITETGASELTHSPKELLVLPS